MKKFLFIPIFQFIVFIPALFALPACVKDNNTPMPTDSTLTPSPTGEKRYLALGDSYTIGQGVSTEQRFPAQTVALLRQSNIKINDPQYIAVTGWTTQNLMTAINQQNPQGPYDVVSLLIGVNDQYQRMDTGGYRTRFTQLLIKSIEIAGNRPSRVVVLSIPDYSSTPFVPAADKPRVRKEIDLFNMINKEITLKNNIKYLDITPSTREAENDPSLIADDGLHPSGKEYKKWAERLAPMIKEVLQ
ncbi:MAG TPA: SGNH/GDSL hydrolase family protein [Segetibacter sp.]|jgi:lysophospholipase L1-like esterase